MFSHCINTALLYNLSLKIFTSLLSVKDESEKESAKQEDQWERLPQGD